MKNKFFQILGLLLSVQLLHAQTIDRSVINTCGGQLHPQLTINVGEPFVSTFSNASAMLTEGFLQPAAILYIPAISGNGSLCIGGVSQLNDSLPGGNWSSSQPTVATVSATGLVTAYTTGSTQIYYSIGEVSVAINITVHGFPTAVATTTQPVICPNGNTQLTASGGVSYLWSTGDTAATTIVNQTGNYYVVAANEFGCADTSNLVSITQKALPSQVKIKANGLSSVCEPNTVAFILDMPLGSTTGFAYQWYMAGSPIPGATDSIYNANTTGSYAVSVSGGDNCLKYSYTKPATIKAAPVASFTATTATTICAGGLVVLVAPSISGCVYTWLKDGVPAGSGATKSFKVAGNYTVIAKINGCSDTASPEIPVVVNALPVAGVTALNATTFCAGDSCMVEASPAGAVSYQWQNATQLLSTTTIEQIKIGTTATVKVLVKDANGCIGKLSATSVKTKVNAIPLASISSSGSTVISATGSVKLKANPSTGVSWQWYKDGIAISNATANAYTATSGGDYTVAITKLGCTGVSTPVTVTQILTKEISNSSSFAEGSFVLSAYPNPVNDVLTVTIDGIANVNGTIQVLDALGKMVTSQDCHPELVEGQTNTGFDTSAPLSVHSLKTANWSSGVYFIRYKDDAGRTGTVKVVKE